MPIPKGGRGHKVPYSTCTVRIPEAIRDEVDLLAEKYRASVLEGIDFAEDGNLPIEQAVIEAKKILGQKRSIKQSIIKLLQVIYKQKLSDTILD